MYDIAARVDGTWAEISVWVPVPPDVAFDAVATGEGISSWFVPCALEPEVGGRIIQFVDPGSPDPASGPEALAEAALGATVGEILAYDRDGGAFVYAEKDWMGPGQTVPDWVSEFRVSAEEEGGDAGSRITLRSGFESAGALVDEMVEGSITGWADAFVPLAHRLRFAPESGVVPVAAATDPRDGTVAGVWAKVRSSLGLAESGSISGEVARSGEVGGIVVSSTEASLTIVLSAPHDGLVQVYAFPAGETPEEAEQRVAIAVRVSEFVAGPGGMVGAAAVDGSPTWESPRWREWLQQLT